MKDFVTKSYDLFGNEVELKIGREIISGVEFVRIRRNWVHSPFHRWVTGEVCRHNPDYVDAAIHLYFGGGLRKLRDTYHVTPLFLNHLELNEGYHVECN